MNSRKAFTLVELLIASSIFLVVMVSIYSAFHTGTFGYRNIEENIIASQTAKQVLERINLDIRNSFRYSEDETKFTGNKDGISFLTLVDTFSNGKMSQNFVFLAYNIEDGAVMRLSRKNKEALNDKSQIKPQELGTNIEGLEFSYAAAAVNETPEPNGWFGVPPLWKETWSDPKEFPIAVKVKLTIKNKAAQEFSRTIYLPLAK
jgi:prepilin-type N-terminal cleavage/methylation domain-containing protein